MAPKQRGDNPQGLPSDISEDESFPPEHIMERFMRIAPSASIRLFKESAERGQAWRVDLPGVLLSAVDGSGFSNALQRGGGPSPEKAIRNAWKETLSLANDSEKAFRCKLSLSSSDDFPSTMLVRWNSSEDDWMDVPSEEADARTQSYTDKKRRKGPY